VGVSVLWERNKYSVLWERNKYWETWVVAKHEQFWNFLSILSFCHFPLLLSNYIGVVFTGYIPFLRRSSFHKLHPLSYEGVVFTGYIHFLFSFIFRLQRKKMLINFDTSWTIFLHAPCSSPTLTSIIIVQRQQQQSPLLPPPHTSQSVQSETHLIL